MELPFYKHETDIGVHEGTRQTYPTAVDVQLEKLSSHVDKLTIANLKLWERLNRNVPVTYRNVSSGTFVTGQPLMLNFGGPDQGTMWELQCLAVGGTDINVTAAGIFGLYVSGYVNKGVSPGLGSLVDGASASVGGTVVLPFTETYGGRQIVVNDSENLYVIIYNGTNGQNYVANIQVQVTNVAASSGVDISLV